jgi:hypothetical protein
MIPQQEAPPDRVDSYPAAVLEEDHTAQATVITPAIPPAKSADPQSTKPPALLDMFYYWLMSRS